MTSLWEACEKGSLEVVKQLVENGADVHEKNEAGKTALCIAVESGRLDLVKYFVVNCENEVEGGTALHVAATRGFLEIVKYLLEHGVDVNYENEEEETALHVAVKSGSLEMVKYLVENGANVYRGNSEKDTLLHCGFLEIVKYLVEHGADANHKNNWLETPLHFASSRGFLKIVKYLVEHGAHVNHANYVAETPLLCAASRGSLEIVNYLVENGADVNQEGSVKETPLYVAALSGSLEIVKYLVEHGAHVNHENSLQGTALIVAAGYGFLEIVKCLFEHGADVKYENFWGKTALHIAVKRGHLEIVKYLVEHGADVNHENKWKETALHVAASSGSLEIVKYLVENGAEVNQESRLKETPLHFESSPLSIACSKGHTEIVRTLLEYNVNVRKGSILKCGNDEIINILQLELEISMKHKEKIQILRSMDDEKLTKVKPPLRYFAANESLKIGKSLTALVYVGIMEDGSEVAVKKMFTLSFSEVAKNERKILELIDTKKSPFIVNYRHFFVDDNFMYLVFDLCEETLEKLVDSQSIEYLRRHGPRMIKEILSGLEFLHELGILHRDLKPSNILVDVDGRMRLADFGISRVLNEGESTDYTDPKGTKGWVATEVVEAIKMNVACRYKKKSDVQVAGMIAYFILTHGKHPYGAPLDRMVNIVKGKPVYLKKLDSRAARQFVSWLINHKLKDRPYAHKALQHSFLDGIEVSQRVRLVMI